VAQLLVRNLDEEVKKGLARRAVLHGRSMEAEVREILREVVLAEEAGSPGLGTQIADLFRDVGFEEGEIQELRGPIFRPVEFEP
jgi:plasmid stability protein